MNLQAITQQSAVNSERGQASSLLTLLLALVGGVFALYWIFFSQVVPPDKIGIRQNKFSLLVLEEGFVDFGLEPGRHWIIPFVSTIRLIPRALQSIHFHSSAQEGDLELGTPLEVPTSDGSKVRIDVTVLVRFFEQPGTSEIVVGPDGTAPDDQIPVVALREAEHAGPRQLVTSFTTDRRRQLRRVAEEAENALKKRLASLSTTDYYDPAKRERAALIATEEANESLKDNGATIWAMLIRRYVYAEKKIDDQIFQKNLQDQKERLNAAANQFAAVAAQTEQTRAEWDAKINVLLEEGQAKRRVVRSEGDLYEAKQVAQGDFLVAEAQAKVDAEKARVLSELTGADVYLAREMAPILQTLQGGVVSDLDPYDVKQWVEKLTSKSNRSGRSEVLP